VRQLLLQRKPGKYRLSLPGKCLPGWMQEMLAERMERFVKAEREANERNGLESSKQETNAQPSQITA
jgi:hypothetical protein